jgi:hypothetical protein
MLKEPRQRGFFCGRSLGAFAKLPVVPACWRGDLLARAVALRRLVLQMRLAKE